MQTDGLMVFKKVVEIKIFFSNRLDLDANGGQIDADLLPFDNRS